MANEISMSAVTLGIEIRNLINTIIEQGGEVTEEQFTQLEALNNSLTVKAKNYSLVKAELDSEVEKMKNLKAMVDARIKTLENTWKNLNRVLVNAMKNANVKKISSDDGLFSATICKGREKVVVEDVRNLDFDYCTIEEVYKPQTDKIKTDLKEGKKVSGAHLEYGEDYLRFSLKKAGAEE